MAGNGAQIAMGKSDSGLHIALHPLVLLTISDYITRHTLKQQRTPIVGALLGQQNGRETTVEHAFECKVSWNDMANAILDLEWFDVRLQQMKDVHKAPALDLVGWWATMPESGPQQHHMPIQKNFSYFYPECSLLLGFHPSEVLAGSVGGKLPLAIYETTLEPLRPENQDVDMVGETHDVKVTYKEVPYTIETGEAEMISVDFVARGGGNATAIETKSAPTVKAGNEIKGKGTNDTAEPPPSKTEENVLTKEDEELIASLTAKANAIKMLRARISLLKTYLEKLPPSYEAGQPNGNDVEGIDSSPLDHAVLRSIQALLNRLALLIPSNSTAFNEELLSEQNDVNLVSLLSSLTENIKQASVTGRKFAVVDAGKNTGRKMQQHNEMSGMSSFGRNTAGDLF